MDLKTRETLLVAAELLNSGVEWCKFVRRTMNGEVCALGACDLAEGYQFESFEFQSIDAAELCDDLAAFNDTPGRTKKQVIRKLRQLARSK